MGYRRFLAMVATSTVVMYGLMYLNTEELAHVRYSQTRSWMALIMGSAMAIVMLGFMRGMYKNTRANVAVLVGATVVLVGSVFLVRSQDTVDDVSYMKAMIPHHSIAVLTSERAHIRDPRVRQLADEIIEAQLREIDEMSRLIDDLKRSPPPQGPSLAPRKLAAKDFDDATFKISDRVTRPPRVAAAEE